MQYFQNNSTDPYYNLAFEEFVFTHYKDDDILLVWVNDTAVVCGQYQNIFAEVNVPLALEQGVALLRRESGGGTVFHDPGNLNYTMIRTTEAGAVGYAPFLEPMVEALCNLALPASTNRICDITLAGLKISGSAQRIVKNRVLHHGTLLYNSDLASLRALANGQREHFSSKAVKSSPWPVTNIIEHLADNTLPLDEFKRQLLGALLPDDARIMSLTEAEEQAVRQLADEKYRSWEWTFGHNPPFTYARQLDVAGQAVELSYSSRQGRIHSLCCSPLPECWKDAASALENQPLDVTILREIGQNCAGCENIYQYMF